MLAKKSSRVVSFSMPKPAAAGLMSSAHLSSIGMSPLGLISKSHSAAFSCAARTYLLPASGTSITYASHVRDFLACHWVLTACSPPSPTSITNRSNTASGGGAGGGGRASSSPSAPPSAPSSGTSGAAQASSMLNASKPRSFAVRTYLNSVRE